MWKWIIMVVALLGAAFAVVQAQRTNVVPPIPAPFKEPIRNPYPHGIAGGGIVEPASENIVVGVTEPGLVMKVLVKEGQDVKTGDPLFELDSRSLKAELLNAQAAVSTAQADLHRTQAYRRKEEEPGLRARVSQAESAVAEAHSGALQARALVTESEWSIKDAADKLDRLETTARAAATPEEGSVRARFALELAKAKLETSKAAVAVAQAREKTAQAQVESAQADLNTYFAGAWEPDVKRAQAAVEEARAKVESITLLIERATIRSPIDAKVIRMRLLAGEYAPANTITPDASPIVLGNLTPLHVRVDIDEFDAQRFKPGMTSVAMLKSGSGEPIPLEFVRIEDFVIPKSALTNSQRELVDTRVLQVIYKISDPKVGVYVGQQLDVFIDTDTATKAAQ